MIQGMTPQATAEAWKWRQWAILIVGAAIFSMLGWQLNTLDPKAYCQTTFDFSKTENLVEVINALKVCAQHQIKILEIKDHVILGLIGAVIMTQLLFLISEFGYKGNVKTPLGEAGFSKDDGKPQKIEGEVTLTDAPPNPSSSS